MFDDLPADGLDRALDMVKGMELRDHSFHSTNHAPWLDASKVVYKRDNRKADRRRIVATYTRAFLKTAGVRFPKKSTHGKGVAVGNDAFLRWAYGKTFEPRSFWYAFADHESFFRFLVRRATGTKDVRDVRVHEFFTKTQSAKSSPWTFWERSIGEKVLTARSLRMVAEEMREAPFS